MAIDLAAFGEAEVIKGRVDVIAAEVHQSRRAEDTPRLFVPGEIEDEIEADYAANGILLARETVDGIRSVARSLGTTTELLPL
jgi:LDH2 family malate/lactate/ureidoglycolate dehydrogenase